MDRPKRQHNPQHSQQRPRRPQTTPTLPLAADQLTAAMRFQAYRSNQRLSVLQVFMLAVIAGAFITVGAQLSVLLAAGVTVTGLQYLLEGVGLSFGILAMLLAQSFVFTETCVVLPSGPGRKGSTGIVTFWLVAFVGNLLGAFIIGMLVYFAKFYSPSSLNLLDSIVATKMQFSTMPGAQAWLHLLVSGAIANWILGSALLFALMSGSIFDRFVIIVLALMVIIAGNFQYVPINLGYFSLLLTSGHGPSWANALLWNVLPAAIGNLVGGMLFVAFPYWYSSRRKR